MILFLETSCTRPAAKARNSTDTFLTADRVGTENSRARAQERERELEGMAGQRRTIAETVQHTRTRRAKSDSARVGSPVRNGGLQQRVKNSQRGFASA